MERFMAVVDMMDVVDVSRLAGERSEFLNESSQNVLHVHHVKPWLR
jgi:hypothetical protein